MEGPKEYVDSYMPKNKLKVTTTKDSNKNETSDVPKTPTTTIGFKSGEETVQLEITINGKPVENLEDQRTLQTQVDGRPQLQRHTSTSVNPLKELVRIKNRK